MVSPFLALTLAAPLREPSLVVRSSGFEIFLAAPKGWSIEAKPERYDGLPAVLFRRGEEWRTAKNAMFVHLDRRTGPDLAAFAANRRAEFLKGRPGASVRPAGKLLAGDGRSAIAFDFDDPKIPQYERRVYLTTADGVVTLFLQCATPRARTTHLPAMAALVGTFRDLHAPRPR